MQKCAWVRPKSLTKFLLKLVCRLHSFKWKGFPADKAERQLHRGEGEWANPGSNLPLTEKIDSCGRFLLPQHRQGNACGTSQKHHHRLSHLQNSIIHGLWCKKNQPCGRLGHPVRHANRLHEVSVPRLLNQIPWYQRSRWILQAGKEQIWLRPGLQKTVTINSRTPSSLWWRLHKRLENDLCSLERIFQNYLQKTQHHHWRIWRKLL